MVTATSLGRTDVPVQRPSLVAVAVAPKQSAPVADDESPDLLTQAKAGDQTAFAALIRRHQNMVFSVALHMLRSRPAAEDLAQEVFLELYRSLGKLESDAHVVSWLRRVASHRCIDEIRRRNHRPEFPTDALPDAGHAPETREVFVAEKLQALVADLPAKARMVVVLRYQEEMDPTEIADALEMPVNTVKSHLRRSIAALRERLMGRGRS
jgi:RNA polymerase sigma-70 factor (ECF subfamily)